MGKQIIQKIKTVMVAKVFIKKITLLPAPVIIKIKTLALRKVIVTNCYLNIFLHDNLIVF